MTPRSFLSGPLDIALPADAVLHLRGTACSALRALELLSHQALGSAAELRVYGGWLRARDGDLVSASIRMPQQHVLCPGRPARSGTWCLKDDQAVEAFLDMYATRSVRFRMTSWPAPPSAGSDPDPWSQSMKMSLTHLLLNVAIELDHHDADE